jgi:hypothetical protein
MRKDAKKRGGESSFPSTLVCLFRGLDKTEQLPQWTTTTIATPSHSKSRRRRPRKPSSSPEASRSSFQANDTQRMAYQSDSGPWEPLSQFYLPAGPSTALAFDPLSPLLFSSTPSGTVSSYYCSPRDGITGRYTSYVAHRGSVADLAVDQSGILSVGGGGMPPGQRGYGGNVKLANRRGLTLWSVECVPFSPSFLPLLFD